MVHLLLTIFCRDWDRFKAIQQRDRRSPIPKMMKEQTIQVPGILRKRLDILFENFQKHSLGYKQLKQLRN